MIKRITRTTGAVKVRVSEDRMGHLTVELFSERLCREWTKQADDNGRTIREGAYIQNQSDIDSFLAELTPAARRDIAGGYATAAFISDEQAMCLFCVSY